MEYMESISNIVVGFCRSCRIFGETLIAALSACLSEVGFYVVVEA